ncbi:MAG: Nif3-like dinuclear metal center hexameric protein [Clostridia bacterium]|nr:Nif3-like dinuclear metal center hexameric protein [Clostridia bacterium]
MSVKCQQLISFIEELAPKRLAEDWDNVGLQLGSPSAEVTKVLVTLDVNDQVAEEAVNLGVELVVCHHPYIFKPLKQIRSDLPQGRVLTRLIQSGISLYAAHTSWDCANGGVSRILAEKIALRDCGVLKVTKTERLYKIVVFIPHGHEDEVREALSKGGAGFIGNYSNCTYQIEGIGTFKPEEGTNPFIGQQGELEKAVEYRLETIVPEAKLPAAINAMLKAHPYEEVAYDVYLLQNEGETFGLGIMGQLEAEISLGQLGEKVKQELGQKTIKVTGNLKSLVKKIAVCGGSGGDLINAAHYKGADVLITGDVGYHQAQSAEALGLAVIDAGHFATEAPSIKVLAQFLQAKLEAAGKKDVEVLLSQVNTELWQFI